MAAGAEEVGVLASVIGGADRAETDFLILLGGFHVLLGLVVFG